MDEHLRGAVDWLLARQDPAGWWTGELQTNVTMTSEHVLLLRFLGLSLDSIRDAACQHILGAQRSDGSWGLYHEAPADLSTTIEAYVALKVLDVDATSQPMRRALRVIQQQGGIASARVFTKIWLALFGEYPWDGVPSMPPELVYLPASAPFNLYDFACWARGTVAPLLIVLSHQPVRPLGCDLHELVVPGSESMLRRVPGSGIFWWTDRLLKVYDRFPRQPGRTRARELLVEWIVERQEADGSWGGIQPPWVYSLIALNLQGMSADDPVMRRGLQGLEAFSLQDSTGWRLQACMSPVWDTAWAVLGLRWAGMERSAQPLRKAIDWLLAEQIEGGGDWQVRCRGVSPGGGWAFEFENDIYPDIDDTAVVVIALLAAGEPERVRSAIDRAVTWTLAMQSKGGAWAAFDRDNTREIVYRLPFADFGALLDPPTEDVTAHVVEMLARLGRTPGDQYVRDGVDYLRRSQRPDGSWWGRWGVNFIYGTWCALSALQAIRPRDCVIGEMIRRGAGWVIERQNGDGGWGETCFSYDDESFAGVGLSTASQTAWAVMSLQAANLGHHEACRRGLRYLRDTQTADGTWDEPEYTGTGFPRDFYINYHLYRHLFPVMALAAEGHEGGPG